MSVQGMLAHIKAMRRNHLIIVLVTSAVLYGNGVLISDKYLGWKSPKIAYEPARGPQLVPQLSRELAHAAAQGGEIFVTWASQVYADFAVNWARSLQRVNATNFLVGALDEKAAQALLDAKLPVFSMYNLDLNGSVMAAGGSKACEQDFHNSTACQRIGLARAFLSYGLDVTLSDADWAFAEDPRPFFSRQPHADLLAAGAALVNSTADGDGGLELAASLAAGTDDGLLLLRAAPAMLSFLQAWARALPGRNAQAALESALCEGVGATPALWPGQDRLSYAWGGRLVLGVLPVARFGSHTASVQGLAGQMHVTQVAVHASHQSDGLVGKRHRLREAMLWEDAPEYYTEPRLLSMDLKPPSVPEKLSLGVMDEGGQTALQMAHKRGLQFQLQQIRAGMALAVALNRTFLMPRLTCLCDSGWDKLENCRSPGAPLTPLPFTCPWDQVFLVERLTEPHEKKVNMTYREYSFLENPRTPNETEHDLILLSMDGTANTAFRTHDPTIVWLPPKTGLADLRDRVARHSGVRRLHVRDPQAAWSDWERPEDGKSFDLRFIGALAPWAGPFDDEEKTKRWLDGVLRRKRKREKGA
ncbi:hypothetical protein ACKKBF_B32980 [Auxenochlorella protothecoides x Auxenochlorella symbiontica]